jgi:hypothetical protein
MPACVLVNDKNELCHSYGKCGDFITIPVGNVTLDIFSLIREDLRIAVSKALKESRETRGRVAYDKIPVQIGDTPEYIALVAQPISDKIGADTGVTAIAFLRSSQEPEKPLDMEHYNIDTAAAQRIADLEKDLHVTQENLSHTVTELESVNAELQAANEELLTANEELQSSNEELQSVNEELYTVNSEYQAKVGELASVNDDMANNEYIRFRANNYLKLTEAYAGEAEVIHYLEMLRDCVGFDNLKKAVKNPLKGVKIAAYYGCLLLRPSGVMAFDDPENPQIIEDFIKAIGATPVIYSQRNECCGAYMAMEDKSFAEKRVDKIVASAKEAGADMMITACPLCMYNLVHNAGENKLPVKYFTELLYQALGLEA